MIKYHCDVCAKVIPIPNVEVVSATAENPWNLGDGIYYFGQLCSYCKADIERKVLGPAREKLEELKRGRIE